MTPLSLSERCRIHAAKMDEEGWYVTANVLVQAAEELERRFNRTEYQRNLMRKRRQAEKKTAGEKP